MAPTKPLSIVELSPFTGSENWYRHGFVRSVLFTDGAKYVADAGGAYWLLDEIALAQRYDKRVAAEEFQLWKLTVEHDNTATLTCDDGNGNIVFPKRIPLRNIGFRSLTEALDTTTAQGRLVFHMFGALAEFERSLIRERTPAGLAAARRIGRTGGCPPKLTDDDIEAAKAMLTNPDIGVT